jgi:competence protein ComEA
MPRLTLWSTVSLAMLAAAALLIVVRWLAVVKEEGYEAPFGFSVMARAPEGGGDTAEEMSASPRPGAPSPSAPSRKASAATDAPGPAPRTKVRSKEATAQPQSLKLDLNRASAAELAELPGVGPVLANRIVSYRNEHGPFKTLDELDKVKGIGPKLLEKLRPLLEIGGS